MGKKGGMPVYATVDEYIKAQPERAQEYLREIRAIVKEAVPEAEELLNYKVPSFSLIEKGKRDHQIMMAAYKNFIGFYPFPTTLEKFSHQLKAYKQGKGSVQFPFDKPLPKELIFEMVRYRKKEIEKA